MQRVEALRSLPYTNPWIVHQGDYIGIDDAVIDTAVEFPLVWGRLSFPAKAFFRRVAEVAAGTVHKDKWTFNGDRTGICGRHRAGDIGAQVGRPAPTSRPTDIV